MAARKLSQPVASSRKWERTSEALHERLRDEVAIAETEKTLKAMRAAYLQKYPQAKKARAA
jgi:hypothetical protein